MIHSFDSQVAEKYGNNTNKAVLIHNIVFWVEKNRANGVHFIEGKYWTYNKAKAFHELFPYMGSERTIGRLLEQLEDAGAIEVANHNKDKRDQTKWYTIADEWIKQVYQMQSSELTTPKDNSDETQLSKLANDNKETDSKQQIVNKRKNIKKEKPKFEQYGEKVKLTEQSFNQLCSEFGEFVIADYIERINSYLTETEKGAKIGNYKNYALTIRNWINRDKAKYPERFETTVVTPVSHSSSKPNPSKMQNWKEKAEYLSQGRYVPGGWSAERGEDNGQWAQRVISWLKVGLDKWWDVKSQQWTFTDSSKSQWLALHKKADELRGVVA